MEIRHLRCFLAVAEELHFARAAERLHMEQSPLSRTIRELEEDLGVQLFVRTSRSTRLTLAGRFFLEHVPRVLAVLEQARESVKAAANGFQGQLRIALSDCVAPFRLSGLLARCREEDPDIEIRLFEVSLAQQLQGLRDELYDAGLSMADEVGDGLIVEPAWEDELMMALPARHPALAHKRIPLDEVLRYPLVLGDPAVCEGYARQVDRVLRTQEQEPLLVQRVASPEMMMALVSAGLALGFAGAAYIAASREANIVGRPLAGTPPMLTTYLLRRDAEPSQALARFIERLEFLGPGNAEPPASPLASLLGGIKP